MEMTSSERGGDLVVRVDEGRIDAAIAVKFKDEMRALIRGPHPRTVLDMSSVDFLDSSGLGAVVAVLKEAGSDKGLVLAGLTTNVEKVFRLTRMDTVFTIFPDVEHAFGATADAS
ncbi:MAG: STAS domain-containing protein [Pseudomonadota bacterium]